MKGKYLIRAVDPANFPWDVCVTDHLDSVRDILNAMEYDRRPHWQTTPWRVGKRSYWVELADDPERGEIDPYDYHPDDD